MISASFTARDGLPTGCAGRGGPVVTGRQRRQGAARRAVTSFRDRRAPGCGGPRWWPNRRSSGRCQDWPLVHWASIPP
ncbi:hypothetical protein E2C11_00605 [Streptomyces lavendulae]|nr:hypothetical protein E2C11_00605 [Streptomyces lavendulae]